MIGLLQGVTELFPVSSLGHSVLVPAFIGGSWETLVTQSATSTSESSPYLAIIVALHVATALALIVFFRSDWVRIIRGFGRTVGPEIQQMQGWLSQWEQPTMSMAPGMVMPGMLADQDISASQNAQGADASKLFLTGMIQHHRGAIAMAQDEISRAKIRQP